MNDIKTEFGMYRTAFATVQVLKEVVAEVIGRIDDRPAVGVLEDIELRIKVKYDSIFKEPG